MQTELISKITNEKKDLIWTLLELTPKSALLSLTILYFLVINWIQI